MQLAYLFVYLNGQMTTTAFELKGLMILITVLNHHHGAVALKYICQNYFLVQMNVASKHYLLMQCTMHVK